MEPLDKETFRSFKWSHYLECYQRHFPRDPKAILEIGIAGGGSLIHWRKQFPTASIAGLDIDPACRRMEHHGFKVFIGSQADPDLLRQVADSGPWDIIIDDGGHRPHQILTSFKKLWPSLSDDGVYAIEDLQMSEKLRWRIWQRFLGGPRSILQKLYSEMNRFVPDVPVQKPYEVHLYPHVAIIKKCLIQIKVDQEDVCL